MESLKLQGMFYLILNYNQFLKVSRGFCCMYIKTPQIFQWRSTISWNKDCYQYFSDFFKIHWRNLVAIHFHPSHLQPKIIKTSFCSLVGLLLTKPNHYFNVFVDILFFLLFKVKPNMGVTAPFKKYDSNTKLMLY